MYRKDLFDKAGLKMPDAPTWQFIAEAARKLTDRSAGINGICFRGKAGWGENMAFLDAAANSLGARWFDEKWNPQFDTPEWKKTLTFYLDLMKDAGPPGASGNGFSENLALFQSGKCAMWIDATSAGPMSAIRTRPPWSPIRSVSHSRPMQGSASAGTGCGLGRWNPGRTRMPRPRRSSSTGRRASTTSNRRFQEGLGRGPAGHSHLALRQPGVSEGGVLREGDARIRSTRLIPIIRQSSRCRTRACSSSPSLNSRALARRSANFSRPRSRARSARTTP